MTVSWRDSYINNMTYMYKTNEKFLFLPRCKRKSEVQSTEYTGMRRTRRCRRILLLRRFASDLIAIDQQTTTADRAMYAITAAHEW